MMTYPVQVIVLATNGSDSDPRMVNITVGVSTTHAIVAGLARLTNHSITVHASNHIGRGRDSEVSIITTQPSGTLEHWDQHCRV